MNTDYSIEHIKVYIPFQKQAKNSLRCLIFHGVKNGYYKKNRTVKYLPSFLNSLSSPFDIEGVKTKAKTKDILDAVTLSRLNH